MFLLKCAYNLLGQSLEGALNCTPQHNLSNFISHESNKHKPLFIYNRLVALIWFIDENVLLNC